MKREGTMHRWLYLALAGATVVACARLEVAPRDDEASSADRDVTGNDCEGCLRPDASNDGPDNPEPPLDCEDAGDASGRAAPSSFGCGARRGAYGCDAPDPGCRADAGEYEMSVSCHATFDGGWYAVGGVAGRFCYGVPTECGPEPTCDCLSRFGGFSRDGGLGPECPGNYWFCIDLGRGASPIIRCTPP